MLTEEEEEEEEEEEKEKERRPTPSFSPWCARGGIMIRGYSIRVYRPPNVRVKRFENTMAAALIIQ